MRTAAQAVDETVILRDCRAAQICARWASGIPTSGCGTTRTAHPFTVGQITQRYPARPQRVARRLNCRAAPCRKWTVVVTNILDAGDLDQVLGDVTRFDPLPISTSFRKPASKARPLVPAGNFKHRL